VGVFHLGREITWSMHQLLRRAPAGLDLFGWKPTVSAATTAIVAADLLPQSEAAFQPRREVEAQLVLLAARSAKRARAGRARGVGEPGSAPMGRVQLDRNSRPDLSIAVTSMRLPMIDRRSA
jgi:hypothetical protein